MFLSRKSFVKKRSASLLAECNRVFLYPRTAHVTLRHDASAIVDFLHHRSHPLVAADALERWSAHYSRLCSLDAGGSNAKVLVLGAVVGATRCPHVISGGGWTAVLSALKQVRCGDGATSVVPP